MTTLTTTVAGLTGLTYTYDSRQPMWLEVDAGYGPISLYIDDLIRALPADALGDYTACGDAREKMVEGFAQAVESLPGVIAGRHDDEKHGGPVRWCEVGACGAVGEIMDELHGVVADLAERFARRQIGKG